MRLGIVLNQEEPRAHCTSVKSDSRSEDFILVCNSGQGTAGYGGLCNPLRICLPRPSLPHQQTGHAGRCYKQHNIHQCISATCHLWCSLANANWAAWCWAVSTGPTRGRQVLMPRYWSLFLTVWSPGVSSMLLRLMRPTANFLVTAHLDGPYWRGWTHCQAWLGCRYHLIIALVTRTLPEYDTREVSCQSQG